MHGLRFEEVVSHWFGRRSGARSGSATLPERFARYAAALRDNEPDPMMGRYPGLPSRPWHASDSLALARDLTANAGAIADEFHRIDPAAFHRESENIARDGSWDVMMLFERGRRAEANYARVPITAGIIERHRIVRSLAGLAYFSRLAPRSRVAPHRGPTNMRLRCHLGIDVPAGCGIRVGGVERSWERGRCIVFDDSFPHDAWNESDEPRIVLIVDVWHPDLSDDEVALLEGLHRYAAAHGANLQRYWANNEAARSADAAAAHRTAGERSKTL